MVGVDIAVAGADAVGHDNPFEGIEEGPDDGGVAGAVIGGADQRLDDAPALDLMVILPDTDSLLQIFSRESMSFSA